MKRGFTLVELSIVLVIIGLLIGGILVGQSLIESAKINAQIQQLQQFDISISNFKAAFKQIPGDCSICNNGVGNGNKKIESSGGVNPPHLIGDEPNVFFPDLSTMKMINTSYVKSSNTYNVFGIGKGKQFPKAAIGKGGVWVTSNAAGQLFYAFMWADGATGADIWTNCGTGFHCTGVFTPAQGAALDSKLDDSLPNTGNVRVANAYELPDSADWPFYADEDWNAVCVYNAKYNIPANPTYQCRMSIKASVQ